MCELHESRIDELTVELCLILGVGSSNNYAYLVTDDATKETVIIDPANPPEYAIS